MVRGFPALISDIELDHARCTGYVMACARLGWTEQEHQLDSSAGGRAAGATGSAKMTAAARGTG
jgi:hypothetical protein